MAGALRFFISASEIALAGEINNPAFPSPWTYDHVVSPVRVSGGAASAGAPRT